MENTYQEQNIKTWMPLALGITLCAGVIIGAFLGNGRGGFASGTSGSSGGRLEEVLRYVEAHYVDDVKREDLIRAGIDAMLSKLDPHSTFIAAEQLETVSESLKGGFSGIGIKFSLLNDTLLVLSTVPNGPSAQAGLLAGDRIIAVNDSSIVGKTLKETHVMKKLRGDEGSKVKLTIKRGGAIQEVTVTRGNIPIYSVDAQYLLDPQTAYIKVNRFSDKTYEEFMNALEQLVDKQHAQHLILDLRDNPGGLLSGAVDILGQLFADKRLLVYTKGRANGRKDYNAQGRPFYKLNRIAVLIDENSASASEIVAGAIQDNDRGIIVGRRSFGKGLVQEPYELSDGSELRLTIARYYTPSGRCIQKSYAGGELSYSEDIEKRYRSGELTNRDSIKQGDTTKYRTTGGRIVYGGGGIMPDIFVPISKILDNKYYQTVAPLLSQFVYIYWDKNRAALLKKFDTFERFKNGFEVDEAIYSSFNKYVQKILLEEKIKIEFRPEEVVAASNTLRLDIKANLARVLYDDTNGYFKILEQDDQTLQNAIKAINDEAFRRQAMKL